jgi:hypothetical protein
MSLPPYDGAFPFAETPPDFLRARPVANRTLSISEATVKTPPMIAHVLFFYFGQSLEQGNTGRKERTM